ncbi:hypothetical protein BDV95DRAFT_595868 [Massariosphaeria phaeospora]|uniref:Uncharacterized protein n=1 Tax=Massariosphaeria phaeospora TaxID=100035 RepID=A0A7C8I419_9PLEO|nr:hypothetical protein BDV95DRAFT_595868 [Massariosphaeria phaeospora]
MRFTSVLLFTAATSTWLVAAAPISDPFEYDALSLIARARAKDDAWCEYESDVAIKKDELDLKQAVGVRKSVLFSARLTFPRVQDAFKETFEGSDRQLAGLAKDAFVTMSGSGIGRNARPGVMTAMAIDKRVYLSSSIKGPGSITYNLKTWDVRQNVPQGLKDCMGQCKQSILDMPDPGEGTDNDVPREAHRTKASCGECMALYQFFEDNPTATNCRGAIFVTVNDQPTESDKKDGKIPAEFKALPVKDKVRVVDPCGTDNFDAEDGKVWGCALLTSTCPGGRFIREGATPRNAFDDYFIGRGKNSNEEADKEKKVDYEKSDRFFETKSPIKIDTSNIQLEG